jgi:hypothetical protein
MLVSQDSIQRHLLSAVVVALYATAAATGYGHDAAADTADSSGRLNFEEANLPAATVEVDLNQSMFTDLFGIGDAALAGVAESLQAASVSASSAEKAELAATQLAAVRQIIQLAGNVIREVHVRVYESLPEDVSSAAALTTGFDQQLKVGGWETLGKVRSDEEFVRVAAKRSGGAVQGLFVVASDGDAVVLVNLVCDVSPENVKKLTSAATAIAIKHGLTHSIRMQFEPPMAVASDRGEMTATLAPVAPPAPIEPASDVVEVR